MIPHGLEYILCRGPPCDHSHMSHGWEVRGAGCLTEGCQLWAQMAGRLVPLCFSDRRLVSRCTYSSVWRRFLKDLSSEKNVHQNHQDFTTVLIFFYFRFAWGWGYGGDTIKMEETGALAQTQQHKELPPTHHPDVELIHCSL